MSRGLTAFQRELDIGFRYVQHHGPTFAVIGLLFIPSSALVENWYGESNFNTLPWRLFITVLGIPLLYFRRIPPEWERSAAIYWYLLSVCIFCFMYGLFLMGTAATTPVGEHVKLFWYVEYLVALFIFVQLTNSVWAATLGWLVSSGLVLLYISTMEQVNWIEVKVVFFDPFAAYLTGVCLASITNRNTEISRMNSLSAARAVGSNIAHELRTPLMGISARAKATARLLPILVEGYRKGVAMEDGTQSLTARQLELVSDSFNDIAQEAEHASTVISMLLLNTSERPLYGQSNGVFSAVASVENALSRYPFSSVSQQHLVQVLIVSDFQIQAPLTLITHVYYNLLKNALYYVEQHGSGTITISIASKEKATGCSGTIEFVDTGPGIPPDVLSRIFERFFTTTLAGRGSGIGLSFCEMVMQGIGGSIQCDSIYGEYTRFVLSFPTDPRSMPAGYGDERSAVP